MRRKGAFLLVFLTVSAVLLAADQAERTDAAIREIDACQHRNEASSRECKRLNQNLQRLTEVYKAGDRSVLPTLLQFPYLGSFYREALLSDPEGFLGAVGSLSEKQQREVALGIAGGELWHLEKAGFEAVKSALEKVPEESTSRRVAELCLEVLKAHNAILFMHYFPSDTFKGRESDFLVSRYSRVLYSMAEKPLWPPSSATPAVFRLTHIGAWGGSESITLTTAPGDTGTLYRKSFNSSLRKAQTDPTIQLSSDQLFSFMEALKQADYMHMPTQEVSDGLDGADWVLEGVQDGEYHIVSRWCPGVESKSEQIRAFARAARLLFEFANHPHSGC